MHLFGNFTIITAFIILSVVSFSYESQSLYSNQVIDINESSQHSLSELSDKKICDGNVFEFLSAFVFRKQNDLTKTFAEIQKHILLKNISYSDKIGRTYKIYNFKPHLLYLQSKQVATIKSLNVLNISGGSVRISYTFDWQKEQIGSSIKGTGQGLVSTDSITFQKILQTNQTHQLQWIFSKALPITISNSLTLSKVNPYKQADYQIINQMLNQLKSNETTVKKQLIQALNQNFTAILKGIVKLDETIEIPKQIKYSYYDYRGPFQITFDNVLIENSLSNAGLSLILSQVIQDDKNFQCGEKVPDQPQSQSKYGGTQMFISNKFLKSTLKYAMIGHSLDVTLSQDNWQSRAFQFYVGDLHQTIATTKNMSSFKPLNGKCQAIDDKTFSFDKKTNISYKVVVNFTCSLFQNVSKIVDIILPVEYQLKPVLRSEQLNFQIMSITGTPKFIQSQKYKITNSDLAQFILLQTLKTAVGSDVIGSHFKTRMRKSPQVQVRDGYLFLYDRSTINKKVEEL